MKKIIQATFWYDTYSEEVEFEIEDSQNEELQIKMEWENWLLSKVKPGYILK